jgi:hypothetical protein
MSWVCACCGKVHDELPSVAFAAPYAWFAASEAEREADFDLTSDTCIWKGQHFFVRCSLDLPIIGTTDSLNFGIWSTLSEANFDLYLDNWDDPDRAKLGPMFGWLANEVPDYPDTSRIKLHVHPKEPGLRPRLEIERSDHPLSVHYHEGVAPQWVASYVHKHLGI